MEQRRAHNWLKVVLAALCVVLLAGLAFRLAQQSAADKEMEAFQAKYRALGYPVTLEELKASHEVPEGEENVAPLIQAALDRIDDSDVDYDFIPIMGYYNEVLPPGAPLPVKVVSEIHYFLSINEDPIDELRELIRLPYCNFPIDWDEVGGSGLGRLAQMRNLALMFSLRALVLGDAVDIDGAIDAIEDIFLLGDIEQRQPMFPSYAEGVGINGIGTSSVQTLLESATLNEAHLLHVIEIVQSARAGHDPLYSFIAEYILAEHWIENIRAEVAANWTVSPLYVLMDNAYTLAGLDAHDARAYLQSLDDYIELFRLPVSEALDRWETLDTPFFFSLSPFGMMRETGMIIREAGILPFAREQIRYDAILTALQVERYRLEEGALPSSLEMLVPGYLDEVPEDPYGDGPLRFRVVGESYVVYSVGSNRVDDGGYDFEADKRMPPMKEIAFVVRRPGGEVP